MGIDKTKLLVALLAFAIAVALVFAIGFANRYSQKSLDKAVNDVKVSMAQEYQKQIEESKALFQKQIDEKVAQYEASLSEKDSELSAKEAEIEQLKEQLSEKEEAKKEEDSSYLIDDVSLSGNFEKDIDSSDVSKLLDSRIEYKDEKYDVSEEIYLSDGVKPLLNLDGFDAEPALGIVSDYAIVYKYVFDDDIVVDSDESLDINFLGQPLTILSFDGSDLTYRTSSEFEGVIGDQKEVDGKLVKIVDIGDDKALVDVDGVSKIVYEGETRKINGLRVNLDEVFTSDINDYAYAVFYVGEEISETVTSGDEYFGDDRYVWVLNDNSIGVALDKRYDDEDEALRLGESIGLPYNYVKFVFKEVNGLDYNIVDLKMSGNEMKISYDGTIKVDGKKIDNDYVELDLSASPITYTYEYKGDKYTDSDFSKLALTSKDRGDFSVVALSDRIKLVGSDGELYVFKYSGNKFVASKQDAKDMNSDADYLLDNGDLLYQSDINDDGAKSVEVGLVKDPSKVEAVLAVI